MNRPTSRPFAPHSIPAILANVHRHFVVDKSPRCVNSIGACIYGGTGCAVGFMLTAEDAARIEGFDILGVFREYRAVYDAYFTPDALPILAALQAAHDNARTDSVADRMTGAINAVRAIYREFDLKALPLKRTGSPSAVTPNP